VALPEVQLQCGPFQCHGNNKRGVRRQAPEVPFPRARTCTCTAGAPRALLAPSALFMVVLWCTGPEAAPAYATVTTPWPTPARHAPPTPPLPPLPPPPPPVPAARRWCKRDRTCGAWRTCTHCRVRATRGAGGGKAARQGQEGSQNERRAAPWFEKRRRRKREVEVEELNKG
jgi:hypothetical protein